MARQKEEIQNGKKIRENVFLNVWTSAPSWRKTFDFYIIIIYIWRVCVYTAWHTHSPPPRRYSLRVDGGERCRRVFFLFCGSNRFRWKLARRRWRVKTGNKNRRSTATATALAGGGGGGGDGGGVRCARARRAARLDSTRLGRLSRDVGHGLVPDRPSFSSHVVRASVSRVRVFCAVRTSGARSFFCSRFAFYDLIFCVPCFNDVAFFLCLCYSSSVRRARLRVC